MSPVKEREILNLLIQCARDVFAFSEIDHFVVSDKNKYILLKYSPKFVRKLKSRVLEQ